MDTGLGHGDQREQAPVIRNRSVNVDGRARLLRREYCSARDVYTRARLRVLWFPLLLRGSSVAAWKLLTELCKSGNGNVEKSWKSAPTGTAEQQENRKKQVCFPSFCLPVSLRNPDLQTLTGIQVAMENCSLPSPSIRTQRL